MKKTVPQTVQGRQKRKMRIFSRYHRGSRYFRIDAGAPGLLPEVREYGKSPGTSAGFFRKR